MSIKIPIGWRLREERQRLGLNQTTFSDCAEITRKTLFSYENGSRVPDACSLAAWAELGVDILYVVTGQRSGPVTATSPLTMTQRQAELLNNYQHLSEADKIALERTVFALSEQEKLNPKNEKNTADDADKGSSY